jgi:uncharacterized protein
VNDSSQPGPSNPLSAPKINEGVTSSLTSSISAPLRWFWIGAGFFFVALGFIGAFVPVMPSTVFFIIAAWCFSRGSERWLNWLLALPTVGPLVRDYRDGKGMPARAKLIAVSMLSLAVLFSAWRLQTPYGRAGVIALGAVGAWFILARVPTRT